MVGAGAFIAATTLLAKALGTDALGAPLHPFQITFGRFAFAGLAIAAVVVALRPAISFAQLRWHALRVLFGWGGVTLMFAAVATIPLAEATAISFLNPMVAMILAVLFLGERVGPVRRTAAAIALAGGLLLIRPGTGVFAPGALLALGAALALGAEVLLIKRLTRSDGPLAILAFSNGLGVILATLTVLPVWQTPTGAQWAAMVALGLAMACAQGCFVNGLRRAETSFVTPFIYLTLVFAGLYDFMLFGVLPDAVGWTGAAMIVTGALVLAWREGRAHRPQPAARPI
ncbi:DMT family transporter [Jannaschia seohaensis]|uniref:EamA-like transporter family protein n=1 Tax=Jannaschia seohaensis TaxID=475081 RepID=A0A2Y9A2W0_9RHOB|nr:DMT family transporter [Jannaschia seohaensis]PWJ22496.1 EamA-like transporter family protein [Jannaschia seohaensis]SSA38774.1 EamA-like transporter family protein [Jannaschia seohaensis]